MNDFDEYGYQERTEKEKCKMCGGTGNPIAPDGFVCSHCQEKKCSMCGGSLKRDRPDDFGCIYCEQNRICRVCGLDHNHDCEG